MPMISNLKAMVLAMVAALALSGLVSATASAVEETGFITAGTAGNPARIDGEQTTVNVFNRTGRETTCETAKFGNSSSVPGSATELTLVPTFEKCHTVVLGVKLPTTITMNGCEYDLTTVKHNVPLTFTGLEHLVCPPGKVVEVHVFSDPNHLELKCTYDKPAQTPSGRIHLENVAGSPNDIRGTVEVTGISSTRVSGTLVNCGAASDASGTETGGLTLRATNAEGTFISGSVS